MKELRHELRYDGATLEEVRAMLADQDFRRQVCAAQHYTRYTVEVVPAGVGMTVHIDQLRPAEGVPSFARKFVGDQVHIVQHEEWSSATEAVLEVTIPGKPGDMRGSIRVAERDGGVTETVHVDIKVGIPLVGGKAETLIADLLRQALQAENRAGRKWLADLDRS